MSSFLTKTAQYLLHNYNDELEQIAIVLPNKRAGLFLKQELSKLIDAPIWLPEIMGAEDFIETLSKTEIIDNTFQLFELFECYKQITTDPEPFEEFSKWGQILIHDFNEILQDEAFNLVDFFYKKRIISKYKTVILKRSIPLFATFTTPKSKIRKLFFYSLFRYL